MDEQRVRQIVEAAFKARFSDIDIVTIEIDPGGFNLDGEPLVDVRVVYDAELEQLLRGNPMEVRSEIIEKLWDEPEDSPVWPQIHFVTKSDIDRRKQAAA